MTENIDVVVIGGRYASVMAANRLTQRDDVTVTLINPRPSFVHRIRLHQLVGGSGDAVVDYREILAEDIRLVVDSVNRIDAAGRSVTLADGVTFDYDYLIYAVGSGSADPSVAGAAGHPASLNGPGSKRARHHGCGTGQHSHPRLIAGRLHNDPGLEYQDFARGLARLLCELREAVIVGALSEISWRRPMSFVARVSLMGRPQ
jgi:NADPH-dependent 2,4-dienoyl-CoA reductase/sulfur reductase-like enzyme